MTETTPPLAQLADFEPCISAVFRITAPDGTPLDATLVEAKPVHTDTLKRSSRDAFSLLFRLDAPGELNQGTYRVEHPRVGQHTILLVPVWMEEDGQFMEAVFN